MFNKVGEKRTVETCCKTENIYIMCNYVMKLIEIDEVNLQEVDTAYMIANSLARLFTAKDFNRTVWWATIFSGRKTQHML